MKEYVTVLFAVCAVSAVVRAVAPDGGMKKYVSALCMLCVCAAVVYPAAELISELCANADLSDIFGYVADGAEEEYGQIYSAYIAEKNVAAACDSLGTELCGLIGADENALEVKLYTELEDDALSVISADVTLGLGALDADPDVIKQYIAERVGCECRIIYKLTDK